MGLQRTGMRQSYDDMIYFYGRVMYMEGGKAEEVRLDE
jgi:hypothetical protein